MIRQPPSSHLSEPLFPNTPLFRSRKSATAPFGWQFSARRDLARRANRFKSLRERKGKGSSDGFRPHRPAEALAGPRARVRRAQDPPRRRSEEHTSELQSLMRISYAGFCLKKKQIHTHNMYTT